MEDSSKDMGRGRASSETWRRLADGRLPWVGLRARAGILEGIRRFFRDRGFLEVDPPIASPFPNIDPNIFPVRIEDAAGTAPASTCTPPPSSR